MQVGEALRPRLLNHPDPSYLAVHREQIVSNQDVLSRFPQLVAVLSLGIVMWL